MIIMAIDLTTAKIKSLNFMTYGGEANIYKYPGGLLLKEFLPKVNLDRKRQKVSKFISLNMPGPGNVISPKEEVTVNNRFVGYLMEEVIGAESIHEITKGKYIKIAKISNKDILEIAVMISKTISSLHSMGIIIGDISENNILFKINGSKKEVSFIDVDSWGIGNLEPNAYTDTFTAPECYINGSDAVNLTAKTDLFSLAVLVFNILTRLHPYNGTYEKDRDMSPKNRILKGISVLGKEKIIIPKMAQSWDWMSPDLKNSFFETFEKGKRLDISDVLEDQIRNSKYCQSHKLFYYSKYSECPLCNASAKVITAPVIVKVQTAGGPVIRVLFENADLDVLFNPRTYLSKNGEVVHKDTGRKIAFQKGKQFNFTDDGQFAFIADKDTVEIFDKNDKPIGVVERLFNSRCQIVGSDLYCVDRTGNLLAITVTNRGNVRREIAQLFDPLFAVSDSGEVFCISLYPKKAIVRIGDRRFEVAYDGKISEYAIRQDALTGKWLFVYQMSNGKFRTIVFGKNSIEYDSDMISYNASPLFGMCFYNNTIYDPGNGKIIGINFVKNTAKEFSCNVVDESSKLEFKEGGFIITNDDKIYSFK